MIERSIADETPIEDNSLMLNYKEVQIIDKEGGIDESRNDGGIGEATTGAGLNNNTASSHHNDSIFRAADNSTIKFNDSVMSATKLLWYSDKDIETMGKYTSYAPKVELNKIVQARQYLKQQ